MFILAEKSLAIDTASVIAKLRARNLSVRDVAVVLGLSPQRVSQLDNSEPAAARSAAG